MNTDDREQAITRELLETIDNQPHVTQRSLAQDLGIALGLANSYLKRCVKKGLVKVRQAPANRYMYYLTPRGFAEKSRLTTEYLSSSLSFYRTAGDSYAEIFEQVQGGVDARIFFAGISELTEIAYLKAQHFPIETIAVWERGSELTRFLGLEIWTERTTIPGDVICVLTALPDPNPVMADLASLLDVDRIRIPQVLKPTLRAAFNQQAAADTEGFPDGD